MRINFKGINKELKHEANLKLKVKHELNDDVARECSKWSDLEHKKEIIEAIHKNEKHSRKRDKMKALRFEFEVEDYYPKAI